jgi:hypothetical protein
MLCSQPSFVRRFENLHREQNLLAERSPPLVAEAQAFALLLSGPPVQGKRGIPLLQQRSRRATAPRPRVVPSAKFTLHATSYCANQPDRSIALIAGPGASERNQRWLKQGDRWGRFVVHQIRQGLIVYRDEHGQLREMSIVRKPVARSLVRNNISRVAMAGSRLARALPTGDRYDSNSVAE